MTRNPKALTQIGTIFLTWRRFLQRELLPFQVTLKQLYVLRQLAQTESLYPSVIAEMLYCDRPTATVVINNMMKQGWIQKSQDPGNRKQVLIQLTTQGKNYLNDLEEQTQSSGASLDPMSCFSNDEIVLLEQLLSKWQKHMKKFEQ